MFESIKIYGGLVIGFIVTLFLFIFKRRGSKIEEQEEIIRVKDNEIKTQDIIHESEIAQAEMVNNVSEEEIKIDKEVKKTKKSITEKIMDFEDNVEYEVRL